MSTRCVRSVLERSAARGSARLLLLAIAERADDEGSAFPSVDLLSRETLLPRRCVFEHLRKLQEIGEISVGYKKGRGGVNVYTITLPLINAVESTVRKPAPCDIGHSEEREGAPCEFPREHRAGNRTRTVREPSEPSEGSKPSRKTRKGSTNSRSPACIIAKQALGRSVPPAACSVIDSVVTDLELWKTVCEAWALRYGTMNAKGLIDWYRYGIPSDRVGGRHPPKDSTRYIPASEPPKDPDLSEEDRIKLYRDIGWGDSGEESPEKGKENDDLFQVGASNGNLSGS